MKSRIYFAASVIALCFSAGALSQASKIGPYEVGYKTVSEAKIFASADGKKQVGSIETGTSGITLRWCRPEFPFGQFMFGSNSERRKLLKARICEASVNNNVLFIDGGALSPDL